MFLPFGHKVPLRLWHHRRIITTLYIHKKIPKWTNCFVLGYLSWKIYFWERDGKIFNFQRFYLPRKIPNRIPFNKKKREDHIKPYSSTFSLTFHHFRFTKYLFFAIDSISLCRNTRKLNAGRNCSKWWHKHAVNSLFKWDKYYLI